MMLPLLAAARGLLLASSPPTYSGKMVDVFYPDLQPELRAAGMESCYRIPSLLFVPPMSGIQIFLALLPIFSVLSIFPADRIWITSYTVISMVVLTTLELNRDSYIAPFAVEMSAQVMGLCRGFTIAFTVGMIVAVFVSFFLDLHRARLGLRKAHDQSEALLHNILPIAIAERLKAGEETIADNYDDVSILFTDLHTT